ncbi:PorT family protein [Hymenobacter sp. BRD128]|uniref:porin family protein n=1 Tax=Hymenobacter sp. BRD128 TaxID=2675878 RepID=UPI001564E90B|nr:porin family protein [Hymenobacter sp. BRD128]QKG56583.1 PorT family protein [Hymenobacter sp. BRD128]
MKYLLLLIPLVTHAQLYGRAGGSLAGFATSVSNGYHTSTDDKLSYHAGLGYQQSLTRRLALVPEIQYADERMTIRRSSDYDASFGALYSSRFSYLNIPVLLRLTWGRLYAEAGPQASLLVGGHEMGTVHVNQTIIYPSHDVTDPRIGYRRFDAGASVGVGAWFSARLGVNARLYQGLLSLTHDAGANTAHLYRQSFQASLTYQLATTPGSNLYR